MRHPSISFPFARAVFMPLAALVTVATSAAQTSPPPASPAFGISRIDADTGETVPRWTAPAFDASLPTPQADQYSVTGMFSELHGEFMQNAFSFRNNLRLAYRYQAQTDVSSEPGKFEWNQLRAEAFLPSPLDPDMLLILGGKAGARQMNFMSGAPIDDRDLYETALNIGLGRFLSDDLYVEAVFRPGVYSDYQGTLQRDDWKFFGDVIATYRFDAGFFGRIGVVYDGVFEDAPVYPVLGFGLMLGEAFRLDMLLPRSLELSWIPSPSWILKLGLSVDGNEYFLHMPLQADGSKPRYAARTQELDLYVDGTLRFSDEFSVFARGGSTLSGNYDWEYPGNRYDGSVSPSLFVEVGLGLNF